MRRMTRRDAARLGKARLVFYYSVVVWPFHRSYEGKSREFCVPKIEIQSYPIA